MRESCAPGEVVAANVHTSFAPPEAAEAAGCRARAVIDTLVRAGRADSPGGVGARLTGTSLWACQPRLSTDEGCVRRSPAGALVRGAVAALERALLVHCARRRAGGEAGGRRGAGPACPARLRLPPRVPTRTISARDVDGAARAVQGASACAARLARGPAHTGTPPCAHIRAYTLTGVCRRRSRTRNACVCSVCMRALTSADYMRCGRDARSGSTRRGTSISSRGSRSARTTTRTPILTRTRTPTPIPRCAPG
jgi:hypothetical protein